MDNRGGVTVRRILSGRCNCHLISGKEGYLLIDCGGRRKHRQERRRLLRLGVGPKAPLTLVLTHAHFDHVQNAAEIKREFAARIMVHALEAEGLEQGENPPIQGTLPFTRMMTRILNSSPWLLKRFRFTGVAADRVVEGVTDLRPLGFAATLIPTPGHSRGSMSVMVDNEIALVGDALFGIFPGSAFPPFATDPVQLVRSWKTLLDTGCSLFLPAHGCPRSRALLYRQYIKHAKRIGI